MTKTVGLLVMAYGTPYKSDIEPYYIQTLDMVRDQLMRNYKI